MLADSTPVTPQSDAAQKRRRLPAALSPRSVSGQRAIVFLIAAAVVLVYAFRGGGSYDVVVFEEHGLVVWLALGLGIACGLLPRSRPSGVHLLLLAALLAYVGWTACSLLWTSSSERTFEEIARTLDYLGLATLLCAIVDRTTWRSAAAGLGTGALVVCVIAVGSRLAPSVFGHDHIDAVLHIDRMSFPFGYWNAVAAWGAMCTTIALAWSAHESSRVRRAIALAFVPFAVLTTYLTYSRAGLAGIAVGFLVVFAFSRSRLSLVIHALVAGAGSAVAILAVRGASQIANGTGSHGAGAVFGALAFAVCLCIAGALVTRAVRIDDRRVPRRAARTVTAIAGTLVLIAAGVFGPHLASRAWHSFKKPPSVQANAGTTARLTTLSGTRYQVWKQAVKAFQAHPADGLGAGTFAFWWNQHATDNESLLDVHNIWLQNLAELGIPGLLLIVGVVASALGILVAARRRARRGVSAGVTTAFGGAFAVYLLHASVDWMWESTAVTVLALAGVAIVGVRLSEEPLRLRLPARGLLALLAGCAAIVQLPGLISTSEIRSSQNAARSGQYQLALSWAQHAVDAESWSADAYQQRGLVLESMGRLGEAAASLRQAVTDEPLNYNHWLILARIETESDRLGAAQRDYDRARSLGPREQVFLYGQYFVGANAR
jgi:Ca2+/Na+ antiporter